MTIHRKPKRTPSTIQPIPSTLQHTWSTCSYALRDDVKAALAQLATKHGSVSRALVKLLKL